MTLQELYNQIRLNFGINKAIRITNEGKDLCDGDTVLVTAKEASAAFQVACRDFEVAYKKIPSPSQDKQNMYGDVLRMKKEHGS